MKQNIFKAKNKFIHFNERVSIIENEHTVIQGSRLEGESLITRAWRHIMKTQTSNSMTKMRNFALSALGMVVMATSCTPKNTPGGGVIEPTPTPTPTPTATPTKMIGIYTSSVQLNSNNKVVSGKFSGSAGNELMLQSGSGAAIEVHNNNSEPTIDLTGGNARAYYSNVHQGDASTVSGTDTSAQNGNVYFVANGVTTTAGQKIRLVMVPCKISNSPGSGSTSFTQITSNGAQITNAFFGNAFNSSLTQQLKLDLSQ